MDWRERLELRRRYQEILPPGMEGSAELCWDETPPEPVKLAGAIAEWSGRTVGGLRAPHPPVTTWTQEIRVGDYLYTVSQLEPFDCRVPNDERSRQFLGAALYGFLTYKGVITPD